jgi:hypothetical protein
VSTSQGEDVPSKRAVQIPELQSPWFRKAALDNMIKDGLLDKYDKFER